MMFRTISLSCLVGALAASLIACSGVSRPPIEIRDAWSPAAPPGAAAIAVYAEIVAQQADTLLSASTAIADSTQLHATSEQEGMMRMRPIEQLELKAGEAARFERGGMHLMLMGLRQELPANTQFTMTFHFAKAGDVPVAITVRPAQDAPSHH